MSLKKTEVVLLGYILRQEVTLQQWCKGSKSLLSGRFGYPHGIPGDLFCIRQTPGLSGRVGMYEFQMVKVIQETKLTKREVS